MARTIKMKMFIAVGEEFGVYKVIARTYVEAQRKVNKYVKIEYGVNNERFDLFDLAEMELVR